MFVGKEFSPSTEEENEVYSLDFSNDLAVGEQISTTSWAIEVHMGVDDGVEDRLSGVASRAGNISSQRIVGLLAGVTYKVEATIITDQANTKKLHSYIRCR